MSADWFPMVDVWHTASQSDVRVLFSMIGLSQGASIFNVFLLSQMALNMLGAIPYISLKKQEPVGDLNSALNS